MFLLLWKVFYRWRDSGHLARWHAGSFDMDCAPLTQQLTYKIIVKEEGVYLYFDEAHIPLNGSPNYGDTLVLKGSISEGSACYNNVKSLDLSLDIKYSVLEEEV